MSEKSKVVHLNTDEGAKTEHLVEFVDFGAEVMWTNHSTECPHFEIIFKGSSPAKPGDKLTGTLEQPVSLRMPKEKAEFFYEVCFKKKDGTHCLYGHELSIRICPNGRPC
jgi:hypothetical protein